MIGTGVNERRLVSVFSTCKDCKDRYSGCHSKCPDYINAKAEYDRQKAEIEEKRRADNIFSSYRAARMTKILYHH